MAFTPAPTPPNSGDPANFNARADAFLGWMATFSAQLNAELPFISAKSWATYGGTANAINLTAGYVSLARGMQISFRATTANTGATTITLDGLGARPCRTITGAVLPSGYIRTDADTMATYDGSVWIVERHDERGSNANGQYVRLPDGSQFCIHSLTSSATGATLWTFPAAFVDTAIVPSIAHAFPGVAAPSLSSLAAGSIEFSLFNAASARVSTFSRMLALGRWY